MNRHTSMLTPSSIYSLNFRRSFVSGEDSGVLAGVVGLFRQPRPDTETGSGQIMSSVSHSEYFKPFG